MSAPGSGWLGNTTTIPSGWIIKYYLPELKARWAQLRKAGIFEAKHIAGILYDWCDRIGFDNWEAEYKKWDESPCNRPSLINDEYWARSTGYTVGWAATSTYGKGSIANRNGSSNLYGFKCKAACVGQAPLTGFYKLYPKDLGHFDSVYRVENWLKKRIEYMDKLLEYSVQ